MLKQLYIKNFTIIDAVNLELENGLTVLTGETGAGKSILIDALQIILGDRAETSLIRHGTERCEISACFQVNTLAQVWLTENTMDENDECIITRTLSHDGRSRTSINGQPCTLQQVRELGGLLVQIHGQNQHQALLKADYQRELVDIFGGHGSLCQQVLSVYRAWQQTHNELTELLDLTKDQSTRIELLQFQLQELNELDLKPNELSELELEHKQLANAETILTQCQRTLDLLADSEPSTLTALNSASQQLTNFTQLDKHIANTNELINNAIIQVEEAVGELRDYLDRAELNPERLSWVEQRLMQIHDIARKHRVQPEELTDLHQRLDAQLQQILKADEAAEKFRAKINQLESEYQIHAQKLTASRQQAAKKLNKEITTRIQSLGMPNGKFEIQLTALSNHQPHPHGNEKIEFMLSANSGQPLQLLNKVASGGELSRIALAIQVITAQKTAKPTLVFDEVDVGIGGGTAEIVGQLLKSLGEKAQVICITHLPQVAAQGNHHLHVYKNHGGKTTETTIRSLSQDEKIQEIARMLGGVKITERTLAHAREMLGLEACNADST